MKVTVMGLGLFGGGEGAARHFARKGHDVLVTDLRAAEELKEPLRRLEGLPIAFRLGAHVDADFDCGLLVVNPAVKPGNRWVELARSRGATVTQEIEISLELSRGRRVAVTGTSGKSTTSSLLAGMLGDSLLGGNIGGSLLDDTNGIEDAPSVVVEISSFQLERLTRREWFDVSVLLNVRPNHIGWHGSFEAYARAKGKVFECTRASGWCVLNADDSVARSLAANARAKIFAFGRSRPDLGDARGYVEGSGLVVEMEDEFKFDVSVFRPPGGHNRLNALAASCAALASGAAPQTVQRAIQDFIPLPHRLEPVAEIDGVRFVNDSIATTPDRAAAAMRSVARPFVLVSGGRDKGIDWKDFLGEAKKAERVLLLGEASKKLKALVGGKGTISSGLREAVEEAAASPPGTTVLFSPGCSSYDMFANFEERGEAFRKEVRRVAGPQGSSVERS